MIFHFAQESNVRLAEGESTDVSTSYQPGPLKHFPLPFTIRLDHFKAEFHPGTDVAKSFESMVTITTGSLQRAGAVSSMKLILYGTKIIPSIKPRMIPIVREGSIRPWPWSRILPSSFRIWLVLLFFWAWLSGTFLTQAFDSERLKA